VRPGDRVAAFVTPGTFLVELLHAAQFGRWTLVPPNLRLGTEELGRLVAHADPALLLHDDAHADLARSVGVTTILAIDELARMEVATEPLPQAGAGDVLTLVYTSGTTGTPKAVELTNANYEAGADASIARLGCTPGDRWLAAMPMCHVGGLSIAVRCALAGMTMVQRPGFDAAEVDRSLRHDRIGFVSLVPTMLARVLDAGSDVPYPSALKAVVLGGGRLPVALVERAQRASVPLVATFGMSETAAQVTTSRPGDASGHPGSAGHPLDGVGIRIEAPGSDGVGEILVRGAQVFRGYFRDPERTATALQGGWLHTGDLGRLDGDGRLWVEVRRTDLIVTGGENVNPEAVEDVLMSHPGVAEAAVYGVPDDEWGQRVTAAVVVREGVAVDGEELREWCRARLAAFQVPRAFVKVAELPRTASGKVRRVALL
jgi:O-succinylbenzoic acid--CoA ligase